ncbi:EF-hand domain-containing protein [Streptomyces sp. NPDC087294]|uniref:EF-hand domain-containing protein n=1 Tax=Streptomyces sp. NPDC087294 TaxID=3365777 RepID=UPI00381C2544
MSAEANRRAELIFRLLDANGNDILEAADFTLMGDRVVAAAAEATPAAKQAALAAYAGFWTAVAALDADGDGVVSLDEYLACVQTPERFEATNAEFADAIAALGDPDGDGLIERPLFSAIMNAVGFQQENIDALFDAFEPDAEDRIRAQVWADGIKEYYDPGKVGIAGDHLVPGAVA